jgi:hypothetical protein
MFRPRKPYVEPASRAGSSPGTAKARLALEQLEARVTPATLTVDATHSFLARLATAQAGDVLQIEPGATIGAVASAPGKVIGNVVAGATTVLSTASYTPGQVITITTGNQIDTALVQSVSPVGAAFALTFSSALSYSHNGTDPIVPVANTIGISQALSVVGDPAKSPSPLFAGTAIEY